jgi:hypothetical protein
MVKIKHIKAFNMKDCPDNIQEEVNVLYLEMAHALSKICSGKNPNTAIAAFNWMHASYLHTYIEEEPMEKALLEEFKALIGNVGLLSGKKYFENNPNDKKK